MRLITILLLSLSAALPAQAQSGQQAAAAADQGRAAAEQAEASVQQAEASRSQAQAESDAARAGYNAAAGARDAGKSAADAARAGKRSKGAGSEQEQLAIAALEGLISAPQERAFPLIKRVLSSNHSDTVKARALFVLSQMDMPEAQALLLTLASTGNGELRGEAIRMIGIGGDKETLSKLGEIYATGDRQVQHAVLNAYLIADRKADVLKLVLAAKSEQESDELVRTLAAMGAVAELRQLGDSGRHSKGLVQAYAIAGDLESLRKIANGNAPIQTRADAVQSIGIIGGDKGRLALRELFGSPQAEIKQAALQGMLIAGDEKGLLELYRSSTNPADKRELLRTLTMVGGDAAIEAIDAALQGKSP